jgi:hypothetical protein
MEEIMFKKRTIHTFLLLVVAFVLSGCGSSNGPDKTELSDMKLVDNANHVVTIRDSGDSIIIVMEALQDRTNNLGGTFPNVDFTKLEVDINHNGQLDSGVDVFYGIESGTASTICTGELLSENSSTGCSHQASGASLAAVFSSSENEAQDHPIWTYTIPKDEIFTDSSLTFVAKFYDSGIGYTGYPLSNSDANSGLVSFGEVLRYP